VDERLAALALAPLLLLQGRRVRRRTPRLPEAAGARAGALGSGPPLRLLIVGDSAAAGVGVATQDEALAGRLAVALAAERTLAWRLQARSGAAAADLVRELAQAPGEPCDVALVSVGVNDVTGGTGESAWRAAIEQLIALLRGRHGASLVLLTSLPPMHLFPALPQPLRWYLGRRARRLDGILAGVVARHADCILLRPQLPTQGGAIAADGFHPGPQGYAQWARAAAAAIREGAQKRTH
jgi:lysophospholipase L1-like esterase